MQNHTQLNSGDSVSHAPGDKLYARPKGIYLGDYNLMFKLAVIKASKEAYEAMPTLGVLIGNTEQENLVRIRATRIAKALGVSEQTVERHLKKLHKLQIILPDDAEDGRTRGVFNWRICPYLAWRGHTDTLSAYLKTLPADHIWHSYSQANILAAQAKADVEIAELLCGTESK